MAGSCASRQSPTMPMSAPLNTGACGSVLTASTVPTRRTPTRWLNFPDTPSVRYSRGLTECPVRPTWRFVRQPALVGDLASADQLRAEQLARPAQLSVLFRGAPGADRQHAVRPRERRRPGVTGAGEFPDGAGRRLGDRASAVRIHLERHAIADQPAVGPEPELLGQ